MAIYLSEKLVEAIQTKDCYKYSRQVYNQADALYRKGRPYLLGYWLEAIDDHVLSEIDLLLAKMLMNTRVTDAADDLILLCVVAHCAEEGNMQAEVQTAQIKRFLAKLHICVKAELSVRAGHATSPFVSCINPDFPVQLQKFDSSWVPAACFPLLPNSGKEPR